MKITKDPDGNPAMELTHKETEELFGCKICPNDGHMLPLPRWAWDKTDCKICKAAGIYGEEE